MDSSTKAHLVIGLEVRFDAAVALAVRSLVRGCAPETRVTVDFRRTSTVDAVALAVLHARLGELRLAAVQYAGLARHQERMLRYLGVDVRARAARTADA